MDEHASHLLYAAMFVQLSLLPFIPTTYANVYGNMFTFLSTPPVTHAMMARWLWCSLPPTSDGAVVLILVVSAELGGLLRLPGGPRVREGRRVQHGFGGQHTV
jgi:hypothetical protein